MKNVLVIALLVCALPAGSMADKPKVSRAVVKAMENSVDQKLQRLWAEDPMQLIGLTQGLYINGYGVVFMSEVNLAAGTAQTPFHPTISPDEIRRIHEKKLARLPKLKEAMQEMLIDSARSMDSVPPDEQITLGISFFYWNDWENKEGLPAQIVMHAPRKLLLDAKAAGAGKSAIVSDEF
jgi:hypothetical protein